MAAEVCLEEVVCGLGCCGAESLVLSDVSREGPGCATAGASAAVDALCVAYGDMAE